MRIRRRPVEGYSQLAWYIGFLAIVLAAGFFLNGCSQDRPADDRVMRCWEQGFRWYDGECRAADGYPVEPAE